MFCKLTENMKSIMFIHKYTNGIRCRVMKREFALSEEIFGPLICSRIPKQEGIVTDIVKVIGNFKVYNFAKCVYNFEF